MNEIEDYLKARLLVNNNGEIFTKFDELVNVVKMLIKEVNEQTRSSNSLQK